jgi:hypothetical protein
MTVDSRGAKHFINVFAYNFPVVRNLRGGSMTERLFV